MRRYDDGGATQRITFAVVAGIDEVDNELIEIGDFLKQPAKYQRLGGAAPKGILLIGHPGTGKILLARAVTCPGIGVEWRTDMAICAFGTTPSAPPYNLVDGG